MKEIKLENYKRKEIFEHFSTVDYPFYFVTIPIYITNVKK